MQLFKYKNLIEINVMKFFLGLKSLFSFQKNDYIYKK